MNGVESENKVPPLALLALIVGCILWGSGAAFGKIALSAYDPIFLVVARLVLAFLVFTPIIIYRFWPIRLQRKKDIFILLLLILCDPVAFFTFEALALKQTSATQAGMMWALAPLLNVMLAWIILREKISLPVLLCFFGAMCGVALLTFGGETSEHAPKPLLGNFLEFLSLCGAAGFVVILRFLRGRYPAMLVVWIQCAGASLLMLPALALETTVFPTEFPLKPTLALLYLGICITFGAQMCSAYGIARVPVARSASISNIIPVCAVMFGIIILGEKLMPVQWAACGLVLLAVGFSQYFQRKNAVTVNIVFEPIAANEGLDRDT